MLRSPICRLAVLGLSVTMPIAGCHEWATIPPPYAVSITESRPDRIRILTSDGEIELRDPLVTGDSLHGVPAEGGAPVGVSLGSISMAQERRIDGGRTAGAVALGALTAIVVASLIALGIAASSWDETWPKSW
jgi:hypothetical protein